MTGVLVQVVLCWSAGPTCVRIAQQCQVNRTPSCCTHSRTFLSLPPPRYKHLDMTKDATVCTVSNCDRK